MAKRISTTRRSATPLLSSFEATAEQWNKDAEQYNPHNSDTSETKGGASADVLKELADLRAQLAARPVAAPVVMDTPARPQPPAEVDYKGLPDPVADPDGYARALGERLQAKTRADADYTRQVSAHNANEVNAQDALYADFQSKYEDIAADEEGVQFVTGTVVKRLKARRIDPTNYMFTHSEEFFDQVASEYKKRFKHEGDNTPAPREEDDEPNRTSGIAGGLESSGRPTARAAEKVSDLYTETREIQRKSGFY